MLIFSIIIFSLMTIIRCWDYVNTLYQYLLRTVKTEQNSVAALILKISRQCKFLTSLAHNLMITMIFGFYQFQLDENAVKYLLFLEVCNAYSLNMNTTALMLIWFGYFILASSVRRIQSIENIMRQFSSD